MVDFIKRKLMAVTGNYIVVNIDENKKIQITFDEYMKVNDLIQEKVKEITKEQQKNQKVDIAKQYCVLVSIKDKQGVVYKRVAHNFELIRDIREFNNVDTVEYFIERNHNFYADERRKTIFLGQKLDQNDKFYLKGPLEKRSSKDMKFKKKQVSLFTNYIQYQSGNKIKVIPLEEIKSVAQSTDACLKNTFYMVTKQKSQGYFFKAESLINLNKWITSIQQNLNYFRDTKLTLNYEELIENENRKTTLKINSYTNHLLYHLENIVKKPYLVKSIYKNIEKNFVKLQKFDRDLLFQVMSINNEVHSFEPNFALLHKYINEQSYDNQAFSKFLEQFKILQQFNALGQKFIKESKSIEDSMNESNDQSRSMNLSQSSKYQRNGQRFHSSYQSYQSFQNDTIESKLKQIISPIERLNYIFISYMTTQYKQIIKFSEMISKILCNFRIDNNHYKPELNIFQYHADSSETMIPLYKDITLQLQKQNPNIKISNDDKDITPYFRHFY